jgi:hypothetical protein
MTHWGSYSAMHNMNKALEENYFRYSTKIFDFAHIDFWPIALSQIHGSQ